MLKRSACLIFYRLGKGRLGPKLPQMMVKMFVH